jgi:hypothetical protein
MCPACSRTDKGSELVGFRIGNRTIEVHGIPLVVCDECQAAGHDHRPLTPKEQLTNAETMRHILTVRALLTEAVGELVARARAHDASKLSDPEVASFAKHTDNLAKLEYGSDEYRAELRQMKPAIEHHQANNPHHPEHHEDGVLGMDLFDLLEMLIDWKAAGLRHETSSMEHSLTVGVKRHDIPNSLEVILWNTIPAIERLAAAARVEISYPHVEA